VILGRGTRAAARLAIRVKGQIFIDLTLTHN